jgi:hypothetical protein
MLRQPCRARIHLLGDEIAEHYDQRRRLRNADRNRSGHLDAAGGSLQQRLKTVARVGEPCPQVDMVDFTRDGA